ADPTLREAAGGIHGAGIRRTTHLPAPGASLAGSADLQGIRNSGGRGAALDPVRGLAAQLHSFRLSVDVPAAARTGLLAIQPAALWRIQCAAGSGVQHRDELRDQYRLAGVLR